MAKSSNQKMKILFLLHLFQDTEENKVYSMQNMVDLLAEQGIRAERKSIYDDLEALRQYGLDIRFRKERPSGYYLAGKGAAFVEAVTVKEEKETVPAEAKKETQPMLFPSYFFEEQGEKKEIRLQCSSERGKEAAIAYLGPDSSVKEKMLGIYQVSGETSLGPAFYGWLTALSGEVRFVKPKKEAAAYREYLKGIAKEYKGILQ